MIFFLFFLFLNLSISAYEGREESLFLNSPAPNIALVQLSFDGVNTLHCGVGQVVLQTQKIFKKINRQYRDHIHFKLYILSGQYSPLLPEYSLETLNQNRVDCEESGGEVCLISLSKSKSEQMFGDPEQWQELCVAGALECARIINANIFTVIIAHDTAYAHLPLQLKKLELKGEINQPYRILYLPHATSWSYNGHTSDGSALWPERHAWELHSFQQAALNNYTIGYISETIKNDLLASPFNVPESSLFHYRTGIVLDPHLETLSEDLIALELDKRNIPLNKKLIFSIGRANPLKGHDITLEMYRHLRNSTPDIHLVMLAPPSDYMPSYLQLLKDRIEKEQLDVTLIDYFDTKLADFIYQWPKTSVVPLLSRMDTRPLTVMEARVNPKNSIVLVSDPERMGFQVSDKIDGCTCSLNGLETIIDKPIPCTGPIEKIVNCAKHILELSSAERKKIIDSGKKLILDCYDLEKNMMINFTHLLSIKENNRHPHTFDSVLELESHAEKISELYALPSPLFFEKMMGGISNSPLLAFTQTENGREPLGVFKFEAGDVHRAALRMKVLSEMKGRSFPYLPSIFQDKEGGFLAPIGQHFYSFMEYIPNHSHTLLFEDILKIVGEFHRESELTHLPDLLKFSKLDEFKKRSPSFFNSSLKETMPGIITDPFWNTILEMNAYFNSEKFRSIYEQLPIRLIHGDYNQTNIVVSQKNPYMIDFDWVRTDVRLLDLASYFRYGGFDDYLRLTQEGSLMSIIHAAYGKYAGKLNQLEENSLHLMVLFSHIEVLSWLIERLEISVMNKDEETSREYRTYIDEYVNKLRLLLPHSPIESLKG